MMKMAVKGSQTNPDTSSSSADAPSHHLWVTSLTQVRDPTSSSLLDPEESSAAPSSPGSSTPALRRRVLQRIVTPLPPQLLRQHRHPQQHQQHPQGSIETVWEAWTSISSDRPSHAANADHAFTAESVAWMRLAIYNGPEAGPARTLHASFQLPRHMTSPGWRLPSEDHDPSRGHGLAWVTFPDHPEHAFLCALLTSTTLALWDVYPPQPPFASSTSSSSSSSSSSWWPWPTEGWTVSLPFECRAIFAVPPTALVGGGSRGGGLLLQRIPDDRWDSSPLTPRPGTHHHHADHDDLHEAPEFVLQPPPILPRHSFALPSYHPTRPTEGTLAHPSSQEVPPPLPPPPLMLQDNWTPTFRSTGPSTAEDLEVPVSSLFSLEHPLEEVLPVGQWITSTTSSSPTALPFTDVYETILWVGQAQWMDPLPTDSKNHTGRRPVWDRSLSEQIVVLTYHTQQRRHALWAWRPAPPPPPPQPLYQQVQALPHPTTSPSYSWPTTTSPPWPRETSSDLEWLGLEESVLPPVELAATTSLPHSHHHPTTAAASSSSSTTQVRHREALAEALGVRRTPRKSLDHGTLIPAHPPRSRARTDASHPLISPTASSMHHRSMETTSAGPPGPYQPEETRGVDSQPGPSVANGLYAQWALQCLTQEPAGAARQAAESVFLATWGQQGNLGTCLLTLVVPTSSPSGFGDHQDYDGPPDQPKEMRLWYLSPPSSNPGAVAQGHPMLVVDMSVERLASVPCQAAQPVQVVTLPPCFWPHPRHNRGVSPMATDILVLPPRSSFGTPPPKPLMMLYRGNRPLVEYALPPTWTGGPVEILSLGDALENRVTFQVRTSDGVTQFLRGQVSLRLPQSALAESMLLIVDEVLTAQSVQTTNPPDRSQALALLSLQIRADCVRNLQSTLEATGRIVSDKALHAVQTVLSALLSQSFPWRAGPSDPSQENATSSWDALLASDFHTLFTLTDDNETYYFGTDSTAGTLPQVRGSDLQTRSALDVAANLSVEVFPLVFDGLHLLYEDLKLSNSNLHMLVALARCLLGFCHQVLEVDPRNEQAQIFEEYYRLDLRTPMLERRDSDPSVGSPGSIRLSTCNSPPSVVRWIEGLMRRVQLPDQVFDMMRVNPFNSSCSRTRSMVRILWMLYGDDHPHKEIDVVVALIEEGFDNKTIAEDLPIGIAMPILQLLRRCRDDPDVAAITNWPEEAWLLIGRDDLRRNAALTRNGSKVEKRKIHISLEHSEDDTDKDGLSLMEGTSAMLFPDDNRIHEAARLLRSSRPIFLRVNRAVEISDHDYERLKQKRLMQLARRSLALPTGRGMMSIGSFVPVAADPLPIPELCLKGRVPPTNAQLALDISESPPDMRVWPEFHNGVAAGLRLPRNGRTDFKVTRTWIVYNRPPPVSPAANDDDEAAQRKSHSYGGLLLALGLRGYLTSLEMSDIYEDLTQGKVTTTVGVLLGMAANKRGTCDMSVSKMLCLHIPSLIPQHFSAIDVASAVQAAAVIGTGFLFQRSSHRMMTEFLLNEIGKRPESDVSAFDREAYTLSCGLALGLVNLALVDKSGNVDRAAGIADLGIEDRLHRYIVGGVDHDELRRTREVNDRFSVPSQSSGVDSEKCSTIFEGDQINTDVTAPGATLALGLMYMKSGNQSIASALAVPDTHFLLEFVRPDFLTLRVIARSLILWDQIEPTSEWIMQQIPSVVRKAYSHMRLIAKSAAEGRSPRVKARQEGGYDRAAVRQIYVHVVAGACFAIGLRYAGTGDARAKAALFDRVQELYTLREANDAVTVVSRPQSPILETCLGCAAIALAMTLSGTGDLDALRLFKMLRWRCDQDTKYGSHLIYGMAIGLLFLGGGKCVLGREPEDLAALVVAFFPRFPANTSDNQNHLQALRHFYALAVKERELVGVDVDTNENVYVSVELSCKDEDNKVETNLPCVVRNQDNPICTLRVVSTFYFPLTVDLSNCWAYHERQFIYVKRKSSPDPFVDLPLLPRATMQGSHSLLSRNALEHSLNLSLRSYVEFVVGDPLQATVAWRGVDPFTDAYKGLIDAMIQNDGHHQALPLYLALSSTIAQRTTTSTQATKTSFSRLPRSFLWNLRWMLAPTRDDDVVVHHQQQQQQHDEPGRSWHGLFLAYLAEATEQGLAWQDEQQMSPVSTGALLFYGN